MLIVLVLFESVLSVGLASSVCHICSIQAGIHTSTVNNLQYGWFAYALGERTSPRLKENSKIITIDGNLASGKGALAQTLAEKLGKDNL